jgi:hypothetical protein
MGKKSSKKILYSALDRRSRAGIKAFPEKPSEEKMGKKKKLEAADLFSLFTANIIKEDVVFTR